MYEDEAMHESHLMRKLNPKDLICHILLEIYVKLKTTDGNLCLLRGFQPFDVSKFLKYVLTHSQTNFFAYVLNQKQYLTLIDKIKRIMRETIFRLKIRFGD